MIKIKIKNLAFLLFVLIGCVSGAYALEIDLWNLPKPEPSQVVWENRPLEVNGIYAQATHLRSSQDVEKIIKFYSDVLSIRGWQPQENTHFYGQHILTFIKADKFFYVAVLGEPDFSSDIYLCISPQELRICSSLASYFLQENIAPDTTGKDLSDIPRYPGSKRRVSILSAEQGAFLMYESDVAPLDIAAFYRQNLRMSGWQQHLPLAQKAVEQFVPELKDNAILFFYKGQDTLLIHLNRAPEINPNGGKAKAQRSFIIISKNILDEFSPKEGGE